MHGMEHITFNSRFSQHRELTIEVIWLILCYIHWPVLFWFCCKFYPENMHFLSLSSHVKFIPTSHPFCLSGYNLGGFCRTNLASAQLTAQEQSSWLHRLVLPSRQHKQIVQGRGIAGSLIATVGWLPCWVAWQVLCCSLSFRCTVPFHLFNSGNKISWKSRLRCGFQFLWCALVLTGIKFICRDWSSKW